MNIKIGDDLYDIISKEKVYVLNIPNSDEYDFIICHNGKTACIYERSHLLTIKEYRKYKIRKIIYRNE